MWHFRGETFWVRRIQEREVEVLQTMLPIAEWAVSCPAASPACHPPIHHARHTASNELCFQTPSWLHFLCSPLYVMTSPQIRLTVPAHLFMHRSNIWVPSTCWKSEVIFDFCCCCAFNRQWLVPKQVLLVLFFQVHPFCSVLTVTAISKMGLDKPPPPL